MKPSDILYVLYDELPDVTPLPDGKNWRINKNWELNVVLKNDTFDKIIIKKGFIFDFASIPKFAWPMVGSPATGLHRYGSILHDYMYYLHFFNDREYADCVFYAFNKQEGLSTTKNEIMFRAVRTFGESAWVGEDKKSTD